MSQVTIQLIVKAAEYQVQLGKRPHCIYYFYQYVFFNKKGKST
jgi:hypothetical protein